MYMTRVDTCFTSAFTPAERADAQSFEIRLPLDQTKVASTARSLRRQTA